MQVVRSWTSLADSGEVNVPPPSESTFTPFPEMIRANAESNGETLSLNISAACDEDISELRERFPSLEIERDDDGIWCLSLSEVTA